MIKKKKKLDIVEERLTWYAPPRAVHTYHIGLISNCESALLSRFVVVKLGSTEAGRSSKRCYYPSKLPRKSPQVGVRHARDVLGIVATGRHRPAVGAYAEVNGPC